MQQLCLNSRTHRCEEEEDAVHDTEGEAGFEHRAVLVEGEVRKVHASGGVTERTETEIDGIV